MKNTSVFFLTIFFLFNIFLTANSNAADSLSYSGRLVQANGAPVAGPVNLLVELSYSGTPTNILCSQSFAGVALTNGVFHLKLDLACGANGTIANVLSNVPAAESAAIRVTDTSHSKTYTFQAIHSMPFANIAATAKQLSQMGASTGQVLVWNGSAWAPGNPGGSGTVTSVTGTLPISVATGTSTPAISISQANSTTNGYLSSADWNTFNSKQGSITAGTALQYYRGDKTWATLDTSAVPENVANLYFTNARALGVPLTGFATATTPIVATDSVLSAFGKAQGQINSLTTGSGNYLVKNGADTLSGTVSLTNVITATATGDIVVNTTPLTMTSAVNKAYVDADDALRVAKAGDTMSGDLILNTQLQLKNGGAANYVTLKAPLAGTTAYTFSLPTTAGAANQVLQTDGTGLTSWITLPAAPVTSVNTKTGAVSLSTTDIAEGTNLYHTDARVLTTPITAPTLTNAAIATGDTVQAVAGKAQAQINSLTTSVAGKEPAITAGTTAQYWRGDKTWSTFATDVINSVLSTFTISTAAKPAIANTDTVVGALNKVQKYINDINGDYVSKSDNTVANTVTGQVTFNSVGTLKINYTPTNLTDAVNKSYVDSFGQWTQGTGANAGDIYRASGKVGIGTAAPGSALSIAGGALHLNSAVSTSIPALSAAPIAGEIQSGFNDSTAGDSGLLRLSAGGGTTLGVKAAIDIFRGSTDLSQIRAYTSGSERLRIDSTGNVGIGTTSPISQLHTTGNFTVGSGGAATAGSPGYVQLTSGGTSPTLNRLTYGTDGTGYHFAISKNQTGTVTDQFVIQDNGNVGIGTASPAYALDVLTSNGVAQFNRNAVMSSNSGVGQIYLSGGNSTTANAGIAYANVMGVAETATAGSEAGALALYTRVSGANSEKMRITSTGNVGIGTTVPQVGLTVEKDNGAGFASWFRASSTANGVGIGTYVSNGNGMIQGLTSAGAAQALVLNPAGGNVGIGAAATAPAERLDLGGGNIKMGYQTVTANCVNSSVCIANCPAGKQAVGGGCVSAGYSTAFGGNTMACTTGQWGGECNTAWLCATAGSVLTTIQTTVNCANIK